MKKIIFLFVLFSASLSAQVGIGITSPDPSSQLDVVSADRGILIPRIPLTGVADQITITSGNVESLLVFSTTTGNNILPGYYYWYENKWNRLASDLKLPSNIVIYDNQNKQFTYIDVDGNIQVIELPEMFETLTTLKDNGDGTITYTDEDDAATIIDIKDLETLTSLMLSSNGKSLLYIDENENETSIDLATIVSSLETITTITEDGNGSYTYTSENNTITVLDVIADVVVNIQNQGDIYNEIIKILTNSSAVLVDNGDGTFTFTANDGTITIFDANTVEFVKNVDGTYTFTNANGETITIDVIADVVINIQNQGDIYDEIIKILTNSTASLVDNGDGTFIFTASNGTTTIFDANTVDFVKNVDGTYTFTNANGETITIDVIADVVINIQNQGDIYNEIIKILKPLKSFLKYESNNSPLLLDLVLLINPNYRLVKFTEKVFDENSEYDSSTGTFTAKQDGIYQVYFQADSRGLVSAAEFGAGIFKTEVSTGVQTLIAEERYLSVNVNVINVINLDVSPPTRSTETLVKLMAGDQIRFGIKVPLLTVRLLGSSQTQFNIHQVK